MTSWRRDRPLEGGVALVTGGGRGMGEAIARLFATCGAAVMVADIDAASAQAVADAIGHAGGDARAMAANIAIEGEVETLVAETLRHFGRLTCAVNNAAVTPDTHPIADADLSEVDTVLSVNLRGALICLKHELRAMIPARTGAIVTLGSISGVRPQLGTGAYAAAKAGVLGLTRTAAVENAPYGIRVNAVLPGVIDSPMMRNRLEAHGINPDDHMTRLSLFDRFGRPEEVAEACLWLCSPASSLVTGHALAVDAGYLAR